MDLAVKMHLVRFWLIFVSTITGTVFCLIANS